MSHENIIPIIRETHLEHHQANWLHEAHSDFIWIVIGLILFTIMLVILCKFNVAPAWILIIIWCTVIAISVWNWYIHAAYHQPGHWLEQFNWFNQDRQAHLIHHVAPNTNYSIASHFTDWGFGTYISANSHDPLYSSGNIRGKNEKV